MSIGERLKEERERIGMTQPAFAAVAKTTKQTLFSWESGKTAPDGFQMAAFSSAGVDVQYVLTGNRRGDGLGQSAVHQAVLDAVELLSLEKKLDPQQLAKAVVKLCARQSAGITAPPDNGAVVIGNIAGGSQAIAGRDMVVKAPRGKAK